MCDGVEDLTRDTTVEATLDTRGRVIANCGRQWAPPGRSIPQDHTGPIYLWLIRGRRTQYRIRSSKNHRDSATWGTARQIPVGGHSISVYDVTDNQADLLRRSLCRISPTHLNIIPRIICDYAVGPVGTGRVRSGGNSRRDQTGPPTERWAIEISYSRLNPPCETLMQGTEAIDEWYIDEDNLCTTLYHELGHFIDLEYGFMTHLSAADRQTFQTWFDTLDYGGQTQGIGEHIAEANRYLYSGQITRNPQYRQILRIMRSQTAYNDEETSRVIEVLYPDL